MRQKDEVKTIPLDSSTNSDQENIPLFSLVKEEDGGYYIDTDDHQADKLWLVVRAMKHDSTKLSYEISKNDIIKLGRIQFRVKDMQTPTINKNSQSEMESNDDIKEVFSIVTKSEEVDENDENSSAPQCRFCWMTECNDENPLIHACVCTGTMKYIHLS